jgi:uncharacterized protein YceK
MGEILFQTGCGSIATKSNGAWGKKYSGTTCSAAVTAITAHEHGMWIVAPFTAIDTLLSAAIDTILLPVDFIVPKPGGGACGGCDILNVLPYGLTRYCQDEYVRQPTQRRSKNPEGEKSSQ